MRNSYIDKFGKDRARQILPPFDRRAAIHGPQGPSWPLMPIKRGQNLTRSIFAKLAAYIFRSLTDCPSVIPALFVIPAIPFVIPAKAGIHSYYAVNMDPRLREDDKGEIGDDKGEIGDDKGDGGGINSLFKRQGAIFLGLILFMGMAGGVSRAWAEGPLGEGVLSVKRDGASVSVSDYMKEDSIFFQMVSTVRDGAEIDAENLSGKDILSLRAFSGVKLTSVSWDEVRGNSDRDKDSEEILRELYPALCRSYRNRQFRDNDRRYWVVDVQATPRRNMQLITAQASGNRKHAFLEEVYKVVRVLSEGLADPGKTVVLNKVYEGAPQTLAIFIEKSCETPVNEQVFYFLKLTYFAQAHLVASAFSGERESFNAFLFSEISGLTGEQQNLAYEAYEQLGYQLMAGVSVPERIDFSSDELLWKRILLEADVGTIESRLKEFSPPGAVVSAADMSQAILGKTIFYPAGQADVTTVGSGISFSQTCVLVSDIEAALKVLEAAAIQGIRTAELTLDVVSAGALTHLSACGSEIREGVHPTLMLKTAQGQAQVLMGKATITPIHERLIRGEVPPMPRLLSVENVADVAPSVFLPSPAPVALVSAQGDRMIAPAVVPTATGSRVVWLDRAENQPARILTLIPDAQIGDSQTGEYRTQQEVLAHTLGQTPQCQLSRIEQNFDAADVTVGDGESATHHSVIAIACETPPLTPYEMFYLLDVSTGRLIQCAESGSTAFYLNYRSVSETNSYASAVVCEPPVSGIKDAIRSISAQDDFLFIGTVNGALYRVNIAGQLTSSGDVLKLGVAQYSWPGGNSDQFWRRGVDFNDPGRNNPFVSSGEFRGELSRYFLDRPSGVGNFMGEVRSVYTPDGISDDLSLVVETPCALCESTPRSVLHRVVWTEQQSRSKEAFQLLPFTPSDLGFQDGDSDGVKAARVMLKRIQRGEPTLYIADLGGRQWPDSLETLKRALHEGFSGHQSYVRAMRMGAWDLKDQLASLLLTDGDILKLSGSCTALTDPRLWRIVDFVLWVQGREDVSCVNSALSVERLTAYRHIYYWIVQSLYEALDQTIQARSENSENLLSGKHPLIQVLQGWVNISQQTSEVVGSLIKDGAQTQRVWFGLTGKDFWMNMPLTSDVPNTPLAKHAHFAGSARGYGFSPSQFWLPNAQSGMQKFHRQVLINEFREGANEDSKMGYETWNYYVSSRDAAAHFLLPESRSTAFYRNELRDSREFLSPFISGNTVWEEGALYGLAMIVLGNNVKLKLLDQLPQEQINEIFENFPTAENWDPSLSTSWDNLLATFSRLQWLTGAGQAREFKPTLDHIITNILRSSLYPAEASYLTSSTEAISEVITRSLSQEPQFSDFSALLTHFIKGSEDTFQNRFYPSPMLINMGLPSPFVRLMQNPTGYDFQLRVLVEGRDRDVEVTHVGAELESSLAGRLRLQSHRFFPMRDQMWQVSQDGGVVSDPLILTESSGASSFVFLSRSGDGLSLVRRRLHSDAISMLDFAPPELLENKSVKSSVLKSYHGLTFGSLTTQDENQGDTRSNLFLVEADAAMISESSIEGTVVGIEPVLKHLHLCSSENTDDESYAGLMTEKFGGPVDFPVRVFIIRSDQDQIPRLYVETLALSALSTSGTWEQMKEQKLCNGAIEGMYVGN